MKELTVQRNNVIIRKTGGPPEPDVCAITQRSYSKLQVTVIQTKLVPPLPRLRLERVQPPSMKVSGARVYEPSVVMPMFEGQGLRFFMIIIRREHDVSLDCGNGLQNGGRNNDVGIEVDHTRPITTRPG